MQGTEALKLIPKPPRRPRQVRIETDPRWLQARREVAKAALLAYAEQLIKELR